MTGPYRIRPATDEDLDDQAAYLAREAGLEMAYRFLDAVAASFEQIALMLGIGERRATVDPRLADLRTWRVGGFEKYLIFYRTVADGVEIVRVLHGARDIDQLLGPGR